MTYRSDRQIIEAMLPMHLMLIVVEQGVKDTRAPKNAECIAMLNDGIALEIENQTIAKRRSLLKRLFRLCDELTLEHRRQETEVGKFGLAAYYMIAHLVDDRVLQIPEDHPFLKAMPDVLEAIAEWTRVPAIDASAQKQSRKLLKALQERGYYQIQQVENAA